MTPLQNIWDNGQKLTQRHKHNPFIEINHEAIPIYSLSVVRVAVSGGQKLSNVSVRPERARDDAVSEFMGHGGGPADLAAWWALWRLDIRARYRPKAVRIERERQMSFRQRLRASSLLE